MYILPLPNGPALITTMQSSSREKEYEWDLRKTCDHSYAAYTATFEGWNDFLAMKKYIPEFLKDFKFDWNSESRQIAFDTGNVSISADNTVLDWTNTSELFMAPSWYKVNDSIEFGIRKFVLNRDLRRRESFILYKNIKPDPILGTNAAEGFKDLVDEKYPFDGKPGIAPKDNTGSIGVIVKTKNPTPEVCYSLYLSMENPENEDNLIRRLTALQNGVKIKN
jgi:hypothetical protein